MSLRSLHSHDCPALDECTNTVDLVLPASLGPARQTSSMFARQTSSNMTARDMDEARYYILLDMIEKEKSERQKEVSDLREELKSLVLSSTDVLRMELHTDIENLRKKITWITPEHSFAIESTCEGSMKVAATILSGVKEAAQKVPKQQLPQPAQIDTEKIDIPAKTFARTRVHAASLQVPARRSVSPERPVSSRCSAQSTINQPCLSFPPTINGGAAIAVKAPASTAKLPGNGSSYPTLQYASTTPPVTAFSKRDVPGRALGFDRHMGSTGATPRYSLPVRLSTPAMFPITGTFA